MKVNHKTEIIHNIDKNDVQSISNIVKSIFDTGNRPNIFYREIKSYTREDLKRLCRFKSSSGIDQQRFITNRPKGRFKRITEFL